MAKSLGHSDDMLPSTQAERLPLPDETRAALDRAYRHTLGWLDEVPNRKVNATATAEQLLRSLDGPLPDGPTDSAEVVDALAAAVEPGLGGDPVRPVLRLRHRGYVAGGLGR